MEKKPRDACGNDLIVPATLTAICVAQAAGLQDDNEFVKKLADGLYRQEIKRIKNEQNGLSE